MTLTQILQKIRAAFYTRAEIDSMGGGASLDTTIRSKQNALSTAQLSAVNSGITSNKVSQYDEYINGASGQPVGTISWVMGSTVPAGYLICNGSAVSRTAYDKLFQAIGTKYGEGDGSTTFNLPNLIDRFLQGSETSGTIKNAGLPNITGYVTHAICNLAVSSEGATGAFRSETYVDNIGSGWINGASAKSDYRGDAFDASLSNSIYGNSTTVQPPAITAIPCIKAFDSVIDATTVSVAQLSDTKVNKAGDTMTGSLTAPSFITNGIDCSVDSQGDGWIRYSNGLQICWGKINITWTLHEQYTAISFAKSFKEIPSVSLSHMRYGFTSETFSEIYQNPSKSNFTAAYMITGSTINPDGALSWLAIGRWK